MNESDIILRDLAKFQVFILTTRDYKDEIKSSKFEYNWKEFFIENNSVLSEKEYTYSYRNPINESDFVKWGYKTIWYGRRSRDHKCVPENLSITELKIEKAPNNKDQNTIEPTHSTMGI